MDDRTDARPEDCESCGETTEVVLVRRIYLPIDLERQADERSLTLGEPEAARSDDVEVRLGELEWWCEVCRIHYPHQLD